MLSECTCNILTLLAADSAASHLGIGFTQSLFMFRPSLLDSNCHSCPTHNVVKVELGVCGGGGALIGPKTELLISYVFTSILSLMKHVKTFNGRYFPVEAFFKTIL